MSIKFPPFKDSPTPSPSPNWGRVAKHGFVGRGLKRGMTFITFTLLLLFALPTQAQMVDERWSEPERLSTERGQAGRAMLASDDFGFTHIFWFEELPNKQNILQYVRFDGENFTEAIDIYFTGQGVSVGELSPVFGPDGRIHVVWREGTNGPVYHKSAPAHDTLASQNWTRRLTININARALRFLVDDDGTFHIVYTNLFNGAERGVYYVRSEDSGASWSIPVWLDPDIPIDFGPEWPQFTIDEQGDLHAMWQYVNISPEGSQGQWVRYTNSTDGGFTWSEPYTIDIADESEGELRMANPAFVAHEGAVHVIWAGDESTHREHMYSLDGGRTWSAPNRIFGNLLGQAIGDGMAVDGNGRLHVLAQIRYPHAVWQMMWDGRAWTDPTVMYLIARTSFEPKGDRIHVHNLQLTSHADNTLLSTFTTSPGDPQLILYASYRILDDVEPAMLQPTPTPVVALQATPTPTPVPATPTPAGPTLIVNTQAPPMPKQATGYGLLMGTVPTVILVCLVMIYQILVKRRTE